MLQKCRKTYHIYYCYQGRSFCVKFPPLFMAYKRETDVIWEPQNNSPEDCSLVKFVLISFLYKLFYQTVVLLYTSSSVNCQQTSVGKTSGKRCIKVLNKFKLIQQRIILIPVQNFIKNENLFFFFLFKKCFWFQLPNHHSSE